MQLVTVILLIIACALLLLTALGYMDTPTEYDQGDNLCNEKNTREMIGEIEKLEKYDNKYK